MIVYFKLMLLKCSLMMVKCSLIMVKCSSMMVKWVYYPTLISPPKSILVALAWITPSLAHPTIIEKLHRLHSSPLPPPPQVIEQKKDRPLRNIHFFKYFPVAKKDKHTYFLADYIIDEERPCWSSPCWGPARVPRKTGLNPRLASTVQLLLAFPPRTYSNNNNALPTLSISRRKPLKKVSPFGSFFATSISFSATFPYIHLILGDVDLMVNISPNIWQPPLCPLRG